MRTPRSFLTLLTLLAACGPQENPAMETVLPVALQPEQAQALKEAPPPESDLPPLLSGSWSLACGAALELAPSGGLQLLEPTGLRPMGGQTLGLPALDTEHRRLAWSHAPQARPETVVSVVDCADGERWGEPRTLIQGPGSPDRVAISPDGAWVVWVSGASGLASLWAAPFDGGEPRQLTNEGVVPAGATPGHPPAGFVAPPHQGPPTVERLDDGRYRAAWQAPDGEHSAVWKP